MLSDHLGLVRLHVLHVLLAQVVQQIRHRLVHFIQDLCVSFESLESVHLLLTVRWLQDSKRRQSVGSLQYIILLNELL